MIHLIKKEGKFVFFHSDGNILGIYKQLIKMGVDAINSQAWCMGLDAIAPYAGRVCFWGEISRQTPLPFGTPQDVRDAVAQMKDKLTKNSGGLIGQSELDNIMPFENIEAFFTVW